MATPDWDHITIPVASGESPNTEEVGRRSFEKVLNMVPRKAGGLRTRPRFLEEDNPYFVSSENFLPDTGTSYPLAASVPYEFRDLVKVRAGGGEVPLLLGDGRAWVHQPGQGWQDLGSFWSARVSDYGVSGLGASLVGGRTMHGASALTDHSMIVTPYGIIHGSDGQTLAAMNLTGGSTPLNAHRCPVVLGSRPGFLYTTLANQLRLVTVDPADPHSYTELVVATNVSAAFGQTAWGSWDAANNRLVIAWLTTTAGQVSLVTVNTSNVISSPTTFTNANAVSSVSVAVVAGRVVVAYGESAGTLDVKSKVFNSSLVDQALDVTYATANPTAVAVGPGLGNNAVIAWDTFVTSGDASVYVHSRSTQATSTFLRATFLGNDAVRSRYTLQYAPWLYQGVNGVTRVLMGITHSTKTSATNAQYNGSWLIIDVSTAGDNVRHTAMVARGPTLGSAITWPVPVDMFHAGQPVFTSIDYTDYDSQGGTAAACRLHVLDFDGQVPVTEANGAWYLGGSVTHMYDGQLLSDAGFFNIPSFTVSTAPGVTFPAGTYSLVAVWTWVDGRGRRHRSATSEVISTSPAVTSDMTVTISNPVIGRKLNMEVEIYLSAVNPPSSGFFPMYLLYRTPTGSTASQVVALPVSGLVVPEYLENEILYTTGGVLDNFPPAGSDGGLAAAGQRLWVATGQRLAASKLIDLPNKVPAWAEDLEVTIPSAGGPIRALAAEGDGVVVFCDRATYYVGGSGFDDLLQGPGFSTPNRVAEVGASGARAWSRTPQGVVFQSEDYRIHLLSGGTEHISWGVDEALIDARVAMINWPEIECLLMLPDRSTGSDRSMAVLHYKTGQWYRWQAVGAQNYTGNVGDLVDGVPWTLDTEFKVVGSFDSFGSSTDAFTDTGYDIQQQMVMSWIRLDEDRARGWARLGSVNLLGSVDLAGTLDVQVDRDYVVLDTPETHTRTLTPVPGTPAATWPSQRMAPEIRTARQKASTVRLTFDLTGVLAVSEVELDVRRAAHRAPSGNRS
jgi:hypothetical protein